MPVPASVAPLTEAGLLAALRDCYDPEIPCNIVDLGLVHSISFAPDPDAPGAGIPGVPARHRVAIAFTPTSPDSADALSQLIAQIENRLAAFETVSRIQVSFVTEPRWTPDRISPAGRARLALAVASNQPANALVQIQVQSD
jgi:metal-sulfur cluster biosynthetic enzyme